MGIVSGVRSATKDITGFFVFLLLSSTLGPLQFGYHLGELNAPQDIITCVRTGLPDKTVPSWDYTSGLPHCIPMTAAEIGLVSSLFTLGGLIGALAASPLTTRYGRLGSMRITAIFFTLGPVAEAVAPSIAVLSMGRLLSGLGAGASVVIVPIYISEIAPPKQRGFFGAFTQITTNVGILLTQVLGYFLSYGQMWRVILAAAGGLGLLQALGLLFAIDTPKWQAEQGKLQTAKNDLRRIRGPNADIQQEIDGWGVSKTQAEDEEQTLLQNDENRSSSGAALSESRKAVGFFEVVRNPEYNRAILAVVVVMMAQQLCGINSIIMYGVSLLADLLASNSAILNILVSVLNIVVTAGCAPLSDILGRKVCILVSTAGMGISAVLLGIGIRGSIPILSAISVLLFVGAFGFGLGPVPFILASELVGPEAVGATQSWALAANWISTFIVAQFFPIVNQALGKGITYFIFAGLAAVFFTIIAWYVPETKDKKDADEVWGRVRREDRRED